MLSGRYLSSHPLGSPDGTYAVAIDTTKIDEKTKDR